MMDSWETWEWSGNKYRGEINPENNAADGMGFKLFKNGGLYEGYLADNNMHGYGWGIAANGNCYEGEFDTNEMHGYGIYLDMVNSKRYEGCWRWGEKTGNFKVYD